MSDINREYILERLKEKRVMRFEEMCEEFSIDQSSLMRKLLEMEKKNLVKIEETDRIEIKLTEEGEKAIVEGLPECVLIKKLHGKAMHINEIDMPDKNIAIGWAKKKGLIIIEKGIVRPLRECTPEDAEEIEILKRIGNKEFYSLPEEEEKLDLLRRRKFIEVVPRTVKYIRVTPEGEKFQDKEEREILEITPEVIIKEEWKNRRFKKYNISASSKQVYPGKKHYVTQAIEHIRSIWIDMGFEEIRGNMLVEAFWNFDVLFVPQDHPAREMQDTFYVDTSPSKKLPSKILQHVKDIHEGRDNESEGWGYSYSEEKASEWLLRTHTTVLSALELFRLNKAQDLPKKCFAIGKVFRNETLDWKHLFEFYQVEGIVVNYNLSFKHLVGYLKEFFRRMGYDKIRIRPAYFPYTELSAEIEVKMAEKGWVELGGAGIFRPEVVKPLLGEELPVLAWGLGLERIIMSYYGFKDIRMAYTHDINVLRESRRLLL